MALVMKQSTEIAPPPSPLVITKDKASADITNYRVFLYNEEIGTIRVHAVSSVGFKSYTAIVNNCNHIDAGSLKEAIGELLLQTKTLTFIE